MDVPHHCHAAGFWRGRLARAGTQALMIAASVSRWRIVVTRCPAVGHDSPRHKTTFVGRSPPFVYRSSPFDLVPDPGSHWHG